MLGSATTKDSETEDEDNDLGTTVESGRDKVVVLVEHGRVVLAEIPLSTDAERKVGEDTAVDTDEQPAHVPEDDGEVEVAEDFELGVAVQQPEWDWHDEAYKVGDGYPLVAGADGEHVPGDTPGDGQRVVLLHVLTRPDIGALGGFQDVGLSTDDGLHHDVVEDGADDATKDLEGKGGLE